MKKFTGFERGMGIGGWLTNYKRFAVIPEKRRMDLTIGDFEHFDSYITERDVKYIASLGLDHIRLGFDQIVVEESPYVYRTHIFDLIEGFVKNCNKHGLNVVLNLHKAVGNYCDIDEPIKLLDDDALQSRFTALWCEFERRFEKYPSVAFELLNEVKLVDPESWNRLAERTLSSIRKLNPTRKVIIGSIGWNSIDKLKLLKLYDDENVIYTFHMYSPFGFTHQRGVLQSDTIYYNRDMPYPCDIERYRDFERVVYHTADPLPGYTEMGRDYINDIMAPAAEFCEAHPDKILWCGEFGTIRHAKLEWRENYMRDVITFLRSHDIPYCVWNYLSTPNDGNRFSLVDDEKREIVSEKMARIIRGELS